MFRPQIIAEKKTGKLNMNKDAMYFQLYLDECVAHGQLYPGI